MEKHQCKLCFRKFSNGRALGGHVRSHMMNHYPPQKPKFFQEQSEDDDEDQETESLPSSTSFTSSSSEEEEDEQEDQDHGDGANGSVVLQTKRIRSSRISGTSHQISNFKKDSNFMLPNCEKEVKTPLMEVEEQQPLSSITENTSEEDVAYWLMLLSRDKWEKTESFEDQESKEEEEDGGNNNGVGAKVSRSRSTKGKYRCETCEKVFKSYQALGGHRASHKRVKLSTLTFKEEENTNVVEVKKLHECPVCFRVFSSGQALGGHKRSHNTTTSSLNLSSSCSSGIKVFSRPNGETLNIDLNLPAPIDDEDDVSDQFEQFSAVSDGEFVNPNKL